MSNDLERRLLRELQSFLDTAPGWRDKAAARWTVDELQRMHGGSDERGRREDGSRPSDARRVEQAMKEAAE